MNANNGSVNPEAWDQNNSGTKNPKGTIIQAIVLFSAESLKINQMDSKTHRQLNNFIPANPQKAKGDDNNTNKGLDQ